MMLMRRHSTLLTLALAAVVATSACTTTSGGKRPDPVQPPPPDAKVVVEGQEMSLDQAAEKRYREGVSARDEGRLADALAAFNETREAYKGNRWADRATVGAAQVHLDEKRPQQAEALLEQFMLERPDSEAKEDARVLLALAQLAQGDAKSAKPTLDHIVDQAESPADKRAAAMKLGDELLASGNGKEAFDAYAKAYQNSASDDEKRQLEPILVGLVDHGLSFTDVRLLKEEGQSIPLLDELITWKLARVQLHLRDYQGANDNVDGYLQAHPNGQFADRAKSLQASLKARTTVEMNTFGVVLPLSGRYWLYGSRALTATLLGMGLEPAPDVIKAHAKAVKKAEADGKGGPDPMAPVLVLKGKKKGQPEIKVVVVDSAGNVERSRELMRKLVEEHHVSAVVGDILLSTSKEIALLGEEYQVPVVSLSRKQGLPQLGPWVFRIHFTPEKQARALAQLALGKLGHKRFALLYPEHETGIEMMNVFWDEVDNAKAEVTAIESYAHDQTTFTMEARALVGRKDLRSRYEFNVCKNRAEEIQDPYRKRKAIGACDQEATPIVDFDALLIPDSFKPVSFAVPALEAEDILLSTDARITAALKKTVKGGRVKRVRLLGGSAWNKPELAKRLKRKIDGAMIVDGYNPRSGETHVLKFNKAFRDAHRSAPELLDAQAHDAGRLLSAIVRGEGTKAPTTRGELRSSIAGARDFPGATGLLRFDEDGDSATPPHIFTFEKGELELVEEKGES